MLKEKITEGKTKIIWTVPEHPGMVIIESKNDITAFDDPTKTRTFGTKAEYANNTTCRVFELLKAAGVPVAYERQTSPTEFMAPKCRMIPLEVIARRDAVGSYLKRNPALDKGAGVPHRFHSLKIEFFLKTTKGKLTLPNGYKVEVDVSSGEEDPFILDYTNPVWNLYHSKKPIWEKGANLNLSVQAEYVFYPYNDESWVHEVAELTRKTFLVLESAWAQQNMRLIDFKIEFGWSEDGELLVADVIDNDSWRLRDANWKELSKESFRQGEELNEVEKKYGIVSHMVDSFRLPKQCLVFWTGSANDAIPILPDLFKPYVSTEKVIISGHKNPQASLNKLEELMNLYPDGGVIVVKVGRSNGLGPILAARTSWPVIAIPATLKDFPDDVWSNLRMPSDVPLMTMWPDENAVLGALNILGQKNPAIYALRQKQIEEND